VVATEPESEFAISHFVSILAESRDFQITLYIHKTFTFASPQVVSRIPYFSGIISLGTVNDISLFNKEEFAVKLTFNSSPAFTVFNSHEASVNSLPSTLTVEISKYVFKSVHFIVSSFCKSVLYDTLNKLSTGMSFVALK
jgi:hypothetical protein